MPRSSSSAVDKALDLIEAVARSDRPLRLSELADQVELHRPTAYRVLVDLVRRGWVLRAGDLYLPGAAVLRLSSGAVAHSLVALARPALEALSSRTGLMVNLQVLESDRSRVLDVVRPQRLEMITDLLGQALPVHRFAGPLALVARLEQRERDPYLRVAEQAAQSPDEAAALLADLAEVERTGFALERGRNEKPVASMSRAVVSAKGTPICALTLVGLGADFDEPRLEQLRRDLLDAAEGLRRLLTAVDA